MWTASTNCAGHESEVRSRQGTADALHPRSRRTQKETTQQEAGPIKMTTDSPICAYCQKPASHQPVQLVAICQCGRLDVHNVWLHPQCETGYLRLIEPV
jgi:hypothetical protein